jgi:hypothetical protein
VCSRGQEPMFDVRRITSLHLRACAHVRTSTLVEEEHFVSAVCMFLSLGYLVAAAHVAHQGVVSARLCRFYACEPSPASVKLRP